MLTPRIIEGARAPLFERLVDRNPKSPTEPRPFRTLSRDALRASVRRDLGRLLNTRCPVPTDILGERNRSVVDYGIPDLSSFSPQSSDDRKRLAWILERSISAFEPRLRQVRVSAETFEKQHQALLIRIDGLLTVGTVTEPVSFPILLQRRTGQIEHLDG